MTDKPQVDRAPEEFDAWQPWERNRHWSPVHPRLKVAHPLGKGWTIKVNQASLNPRTLAFYAGSRYESRWFYAVQHYGSDFIEISERVGLGGPYIFFDAEREPGIGRYIHMAMDVQWPQGPRGVARRPVS